MIPAISYCMVQFDLPLRHGQLPQFRESFLRGLETETEKRLVSHEYKNEEGKTIYEDRYPLIQFRCRQHRAAVYAIGEGVALLERFLHRHCPANPEKARPFVWEGGKVRLQVVQLEKEHNRPLSLIKEGPAIYRLHTWLPLNAINHQWWKENRNQPDVEKTKKLEQILVSHICVLIFKSGGYIARKRIKLRILDKDRLREVYYKDTGQVAFDIRFEVNLRLPPGAGLGNHPAFGFGWQRPEYE